MWCLTGNIIEVNSLLEKGVVSRRASSRVIYDRGRQVSAWANIDWKRTQYNVRRLQARITKAAQAKKWRQPPS
ncbi:reverse transcriptase N-terminal domain-containing protein [Candidatus Uabimicrobium sp. HlEnr_7]|uniref:reverse transcriptase N-terminal domain-containing protein n=1 Tax=Candidatus Uabimicrobium helgolandensis TaxID=3095367 RepID=UPI003557A9FD